MSPIALVAIAVFVVFLVNKFVKNQFGKLNAPGPSPLISLPLVGHGYLLGTNVMEALFHYKEKYGGIFRSVYDFDVMVLYSNSTISIFINYRLDVGPLPTIFLTSYDVINEAVKTGGITSRPLKYNETYVKYIRPVDSNGERELHY